MRFRLRCIVAMLALTAAVSVVASAQTDDIADAASMLMTDVARQQFEALSPVDRAAALDTFWGAFDPTPGTPVNELRTIFERRARRAREMFDDESRPGQLTDRGRVLAVLGLPDEIERRSERPTDAPPEIVWTYGHGEARTVRFERTATGDYTLADPVELNGNTFLASVENELGLLLASDIGALEGVSSLTTGGRGAEGADAAGAEHGTEPEPPAPEENVAPEVRIWMQMVFGGAMRDDLDVTSRLDTFPSTDGTYTVLSFEVDRDALAFEVPTATAMTPTPGAAGAAGAEAGSEQAGAEGAESAAAGEQTVTEPGETPPGETPGEIADPDALLATLTPRARLKVFGAFLQGEPGAEDTVHAFIIPFELRADEERGSREERALRGVPLGPAVPPAIPADAAQEPIPSPTGLSLSRSLAATLAPGTYRLAWGVLDQTTGKATTRDETVVIPDYATSGLQLTRPLIARPPHGQAARPLTADEVVRGVRLGNLVLDIDLDEAFARDEEIEVVLMVSGWESDPSQPGKPALQVEYRLVEETAEGRRAIARLPEQSLDFSVLGQRIPLAQVQRIEPGGTYQIEVRVTDLTSGETATTAATLHIAPAPAGATGTEPQASAR